ncbi:MAG: FAD-dependent oxidoreductase, partial [Actinobacteria bacterium]|nr:FAD-dependent oxidoreductase [Actinomycetota bacterium]
MQSNSETEVVIIGAGVVGASIALEIQRSGRTVLVVDKGESVGGGSTSASSALIRFNYSTRSGVVAAWESFHRWNAWEEHLGYVDGPVAKFHPLSMLLLEPPDFDRSSYLEHFNELGIPFEELTESDLSEKYPMFDTGRFWPPSLPDDEHFFEGGKGKLGGFFVPNGGFIDDPQLATQ